MKTINFKPKFIPLIRAGTKTQTRRPWAKSPHAPKYSGFYIASDGKEKTVISVSCAYRQKLHAITAREIRAEGFETLVNFIAAWQEIYGDTEYDAKNNPLVWAYKFEFISDDINE
jgi:hypothetical protein